MKKVIASSFLSALLAIALYGLFAFKNKANDQVVYQYRQFSTIESTVEGGFGRSRIVSTDANGTTVEKDLMNFYSMVGINFGNIANNDGLIVAKINEWTNDGWELYQVSPGAQTNISGSSGSINSKGIFITRYLFRKAR